MWMNILVSAISGAGIVAVAWLTGKFNVVRTRVENQKSPYEAMSSRIVVLEEQVAKLWAENEALKSQLAEGRSQMSDLKRWVTACVAWLEFHEIDHSQLPQPPSWLCPR